MAASYHGRCFSSVQGAADASCAGDYPFTFSNAGTLVTVSCTGATVSGTVGDLALSSVSPGASAVALTQEVSFPDCDPAEVYTASLSVWAAALAMLAVVWGVKRVYVVLHSGRSES